MENKHLILESYYEDVPHPTQLDYTTACGFILNEAAKNVAAGKTKWLSDCLTGETLHYSDVDLLSAKVASAMRKRGMVQRDVALYLTVNVTRSYAMLLGIWRIGGVTYASFPEDTHDTLLERLKSSGANWIFCDMDTVSKVKSVVSSVSSRVEIIVFGSIEEAAQYGVTSIDSIFEDDGQACPAQPVGQLNSTIHVCITSGTTGRSKGAVYTNFGVLAFFMATSKVPHTDDPALLLTKTSYLHGSLFPIKTIIGANYVVLIGAVTKLGIFKAVHEYKPVRLFGFPKILSMFTNQDDPDTRLYDFSSLHLIFNVGVPLTSQFLSSMKNLPNVKYVVNSYGMTECGFIATTIDLTGNTRDYQTVPNTPPLSVGQLYPSTKVQIVSIDTREKLGANQRGEILVQTPVLFSHYFKPGEDLRDALHNPPERSNDPAFNDGWFQTGDLGYYDENGFLFVVDRIKEIFKYYNCHISPVELEAVLLRHPAVTEAVVFGILDPEGGDHVPRAVVTVGGSLADSVTANDIRDFVDAKVEPLKQLRGGVFIVPSIPKGKSGKVVRKEVAEMKL